MLGFNNVADLVARDVGFEIGFQRRYGGGFFGLVVGGVVGNEFGEFFFQQLVFGLEAGNQAKNLLQNLPQPQAAVYSGGFAEFVQGVKLVGFVKHLTVHVVDHFVPLASFNGLHNGGIFADDVFKFLVKHAVNTHAVQTNDFFFHGVDQVCATVLVGQTGFNGPFATAAFITTLCGFGQFQNLVVLEFFFKVFAVGKKVEQFVRRFACFFAGLLNVFLQVGVKKLFRKIVFACTAPFDLNKVSGRENRPEKP